MGTALCVPRRGGAPLRSYFGVPLPELARHERPLTDHRESRRESPRGRKGPGRGPGKGPGKGSGSGKGPGKGPSGPGSGSGSGSGGPGRYVPAVPLLVQDVAAHWEAVGAAATAGDDADAAAVAPDSVWLARAEQIIDAFARKNRRLLAGKKKKKESARGMFEKPLAEINGKEALRAVHCVALLTHFLRKLPEPLLPAVFVRQMEEILMNSHESGEAKVQTLNKATHELFGAAYPVEYATFQYVKQLVQRHCDDLLAVEVEVLAQIMVREGDACVVQFLVQQFRPPMNTVIIEPQHVTSEDGNSHTEHNVAQSKSIDCPSENFSQHMVRNSMKSIESKESRESNAEDRETQCSTMSSKVSGARTDEEFAAAALERMRYVDSSEYSTRDESEEEPGEMSEHREEEQDEEKNEAEVPVQSYERLTAYEMAKPVELTPDLRAVSPNNEKLTDVCPPPASASQAPAFSSKIISVNSSPNPSLPSPELPQSKAAQHPRFAALLRAKQRFLGLDHLPPRTVSTQSSRDTRAHSREVFVPHALRESIAALSAQCAALSRAADDCALCGDAEERITELRDALRQCAAAHAVASADVEDMCAQLRETQKRKLNGNGQDVEGRIRGASCEL